MSAHRSIVPTLPDAPDAFGQLTEPFRRELLVHCYRMLGSLLDAEDVVQETLLRAWQGRAGFEGRASVRTWLYQIATNLCLNHLAQRRRRGLPSTWSRPAESDQPLGTPITEPIWLEPFPDQVLGEAGESGPEGRYLAKEMLSLAWMTALQVLPPRQRAVLILREVLSWRASEVAALLDTSEAAVASLLHRARAAVARVRSAEAAQPAPLDPKTRGLLDRYLVAWETADIPGLLALLTDDAAMLMPPFPIWYLGQASVGAFAAASLFGDGPGSPFAGAARGRWRLRPIQANGQPAFGAYQRAAVDGDYEATAIQVLDLVDGRISAITAFVMPALFDRFGLAASLVCERRPSYRAGSPRSPK